MKQAKSLRILIVADASGLIAELTRISIIHLQADVVVADTIEAVREMTAAEVFDVILAQRRLTGGEELALFDALALDAAPVIIIDRRLDAEAALAAMRRGAADVFASPVDADRLSSTIRSVVQRDRDRRHATTRSRRLRQLSSRLVRDRRELRRRVDLICHDVVDAYQRLAQRVVAIQGCEAPGVNASAKVDSSVH